MNPKKLGVIGPGFLNQVPTLYRASGFLNQVPTLGLQKFGLQSL